MTMRDKRETGMGMEQEQLAFFETRREKEGREIELITSVASCCF
jgi:hypothetical protein